MDQSLWVFIFLQMVASLPAWMQFTIDKHTIKTSPTASTCFLKNLIIDPRPFCDQVYTTACEIVTTACVSSGVGISP